jgi:hypothetical protein
MKIKLSRKWWISIGVTVGLLALLGITGAAVAQDPGPGGPVTDASAPLAPGGGPSEPMAFSYQGRLMDGGAPANGNYDFIMGLYDNPTVGSPLASCYDVGTGSLLNQPVQNGLFTFYLYCGGSNSSVFTGSERWIQAQVRRTGTVTYTTLPRQPISPTPYAFSLYPWSVISSTAVGGSFGNSILNVYNRNTVSTWSAFHAQSASGNAVRGESADGNGIYGYTENGYAMYGYDGGSAQARGYGGYFYSANGVGVYGYSGASRTWNNQYAPGVYGRSYDGVGVYGVSNSSSSWIAGVFGENTGGGYGVLGISRSASGYGGYFDNFSSGIALYANGNGAARNRATLRVDNTQTSGGMAAYITNNSNYHTAHFYNSGTGGGVLYLQNGGTDSDGTGGGDFITAVNDPENDAQFRVLTSGEVRSDVGYYTPAADFAEMLPAARELNPGDVLIVGQDGKLIHSTQPFQTSVVGVYSTQPGFVGGQPVEGDLTDRIPLAIVGVVPVKVSAENGSILPGDLLTTSSTPGHAMKAGPNPPVGTVIGKALAALEQGTGVIQMLVTLQ